MPNLVMIGASHILVPLVPLGANIIDLTEEITAVIEIEDEIVAIIEE